MIVGDRRRGGREEGRWRGREGKGSAGGGGRGWHHKLQAVVEIEVDEVGSTKSDQRCIHASLSAQTGRLSVNANHTTLVQEDTALWWVLLT